MANLLSGLSLSGALPGSSSSSLSAGDNRLVRGTMRKSWSSNKRIISKLIFSELIQNFSPALAVLPVAYSVGGEFAFIAALAPQIDIMLFSFGIPPAGLVIAKILVNNLGAQNMVDGIQAGSSGFMAPRPGYLFSFQNDTLGIPSGEFSQGAVWRSAGETFILSQKNQWIENIDWIGFVPNISWLGDWFTYTDTGSLFPSNFASSVPPTITPQVTGDGSDDDGNGNGNGNGLAPLVIAGIIAKLLFF